MGTSHHTAFCRIGLGSVACSLNYAVALIAELTMDSQLVECERAGILLFGIITWRIYLQLLESKLRNIFGSLRSFASTPNEVKPRLFWVIVFLFSLISANYIKGQFADPFTGFVEALTHTTPAELTTPAAVYCMFVFGFVTILYWELCCLKRDARKFLF